MGLKHVIEGGIDILKVTLKKPLTAGDLSRALKKPMQAGPEGATDLADDVSQIFSKNIADLEAAGKAVPSAQDLQNTARDFYRNKVLQDDLPMENMQHADDFADQVVMRTDGLKLEDASTDAMHTAARKVSPQQAEIQGHAIDIKNAIKQRSMFSDSAKSDVTELITKLKSQSDKFDNAEEAVTKTPREVLDAISSPEGYTPSIEEVSSLKTALNMLTDGKKVKHGVPFKRVSVQEPHNPAEVNRIMNGGSPSIMPDNGFGNFVRSHPILSGSIVVAAVSSTSLSNNDTLSYPGDTFNGVIGSLSPVSWIPGTEGGPDSRDSMGVTFFKAKYRLDGQNYVDDALFYIENPATAGDFLKEAVSETAASRMAKSGAGQEVLDNLSDRRSIVLYELRSTMAFLSPEEQQRVNSVYDKLDGVVKDNLLRAESTIQAKSTEQIAESSIKSTIASGSLDLTGSQSSFASSQVDSSKFPIELNTVFTGLSTWGQLSGNEQQIKQAWDNANTDGNSTIDNTQEWDAFRNNTSPEVKGALNLIIK